MAALTAVSSIGGRLGPGALRFKAKTQLWFAALVNFAAAAGRGRGVIDTCAFCFAAF